MPVASLFAVPPAAVTRHTLWAACVLWALLGYPMARWLPVTMGWENGLLENLQLAQLLAGAGLALWYARSGHAALGYVAVAVWLVLAAREVSWGATLWAEPLGMGWSGPVYSSSVLWYKPFVYPAIGAVLLVAGVALVRSGALSLVYRLARSTQFVWVELVLAVAAAMAASYFEGQLPREAADPGLGMASLVLEEWLECAAYGALLVGQWQLFTLARLHARPQDHGNEACGSRPL